MFASKDVFLTPPATGAYTIGKSVRLRSSASAYLNRTPSSSTNRRISTFSAWVKWSLTGSSVYPEIFSAAANGLLYRDAFYFANNTLNVIFNGGVAYSLTTTQVFRDPSAWYHFVMAIDTTQATASNRVKLYVNGVQITAFSTANYPIQNYDPNFNSAIVHNIGRSTDANDYIDGYMTEINFVDGQQLTPSSFGSTNALTGVWQPAKYTGTYGTNGFYLNFSSNGSSAALGTDFSGNSNTWTVNNISVTAGVTYDSMTDVPTLTSATAANYCVGNPLYVDGSVSVTWTNGNLTWSCPNTGSGKSTLAVSTGKWYWELVYATNAYLTGVSDSASVGRYTNGVMYESNGTKWINGTNTSYGATYTTGDVIGVALDMDGGTVTFYKNNTSQGSISLSGASITNATPTLGGGAGVVNTGNINFGQRPFTYTAPTGYVALNTYNLPTSTITNGAAYMAATLYTGNASTQTITNTVNGISFASDLVWIKDRSAARQNSLSDIVRGTNKELFSDSTDADTSPGTPVVTAFNSNGFTIGANGTVNATGESFVAWQWKANGSGVTNTNGTITSTVSAGATQGFSVVTYTHNGTNAATVGHGLGVTPSFIINKQRSAASNWRCYHVSLTAGYNIQLNLTSAQGSAADIFPTAPTSSVFTPGNGDSASGQTFVAYCFAAVKGFSAFGSYTGNGSADGPFVYCGFRPRWVMWKNSSTGGTDWTIIDSSRNTYNVANSGLQPNGSYAEASNSNYQIDFLSNGFKLRTTNAEANQSGISIIYAAFAENPFKNALAR